MRTITRDERRRAARTLLLLALAFAPLPLLAQRMKDGSVFSDTPPAGAPTASCTVEPVHDASRLLVTTGDAPLRFVFACGYNRPTGKCVTLIAKPGFAELLPTYRFTPSGLQNNGWSCVAGSDGLTGWIESDRLSPLSPTPAISTAEWLGWWRRGKDEAGIRNDRLLVTRSRSKPTTLHVSGRAYWYGLGDNVHTGSVDADGSAYGDTLHVVDGNGPSGCVLDLVYHPTTHTFTATDNENCGGMNVRFQGEWQRFTPATAAHR